jgi:D-alanyl-D-alanine carboxypeptidase (penicillin-binding protein 5/6)
MRSFKAGILACVLFVGLVGLLWGYSLQNDPHSLNETTLSQQTDSQTADTQQTTQATQASTAPQYETQSRPTLPEPAFPLTATHVFVYDTAADRLLFSKGDIQGMIPPASLTKLFSAYVALQYLEPTTVITAGEEVGWIDPESSMAFIYRGQKVTVDTCVEGMIVQSGNDASYILAVAAGRAIHGNPQLSATAALGVFVGKMNELALQLGLENTHFANPDGIDTAGHYSSLQDLITISRLALENPVIRQHAATAKDAVTYASGQTVNWKNTNELLHPESEFYCQEACGLKTGSTTGAGKCLISAFRQTDGYLLIGVLGCPEEDDRYIDTLNLYRYYTKQPASPQ